MDGQATLNSRPFLVPHSNTKQHKNFFIHTATSLNQLSDDLVKVRADEDFKLLISTPSTILAFIPHAHTPLLLHLLF